MFHTLTSPVLKVAFTSGNQCRNFATLKDISIRLKSVKNIQKITKSMKMVAAAKYAKAERDLRPARPYGHGAQAFYQNVELTEERPKKPEHLMIILTSDRGLCGAVHSGIARLIKKEMKEKPDDVNYNLICVGDKAKALLQRFYPKSFILCCNEIGRKPPTFDDASILAQQILNLDIKFDQGSIYYNEFKSAVSYKTKTLPIFSEEIVSSAEKLSIYDSLDSEVVRCYLEYSLTNLLFYGLKECACSEQSSRMTAMDSASKNAGEMITKLTLYFNRTRQAVITRELIDIVIGASAL
uniref:ATP synthase subunit gamma n=1 Tax=Romanomermis culicivorax TaxID=13658 RepID=A0A915HI84_ROMCU